VKPPPFDYHAPRTLGEALRVLTETGGHGKVLAGGQSLIPLLNMRLAAPEHLIDINRIAELDTVAVEPAQAGATAGAGAGGVRVGALARHSRVARSAEATAVQPLLRQALRLVAHPVIRNRGTVVGSIVHADPAAELPAVLALLDGSVRLARSGASTGGTVVAAGPAPAPGSAGPASGRDGTAASAAPAPAAAPRVRDVAAADFFTGPLESALEPGELAVSAFFPALPPRTGTAFREVARRHGDYALAGVAALVGLDEDLLVEAARVACIGVGPVPLVVDVTAECARRPPAAVDWTAVAQRVADRVEPEDDIHATADYRRHLTAILAEQTLVAAAGEAGRD
jgi:carbon-monoxide dehydrogenase medium subunit